MAASSQTLVEDAMDELAGKKTLLAGVCGVGAAFALIEATTAPGSDRQESIMSITHPLTNALTEPPR